MPLVTRVRDNWGEDRFNVELKIDSDRANLAGLTNRDIAGASSTAVSGAPLTTLREGDKQIPVVARMRADEFAQLARRRQSLRVLEFGQAEGSREPGGQAGLQLQRRGDPAEESVPHDHRLGRGRTRACWRPR